jgi:hypothetical protein
LNRKEKNSKKSITLFGLDVIGLWQLAALINVGVGVVMVGGDQ